MANISVFRLFQNSLLALLLLGLGVLPISLFHTFSDSSRSIFVTQVLLLSGSAAIALFAHRFSTKWAVAIISWGVLLSVVLSLHGGPLSSCWVLLSVVPMLFLGFRCGRKGIYFATISLMVAAGYWTLVQRRTGTSVPTTTTAALAIRALCQMAVIALGGIVIDHLLGIVREREIFLMKVFSDLDIGVSVFDVDEQGELRISAVNPRVSQLFGMPEGKSLGKTYRELVADGYLKITESMVRRALDTGEAQRNEDRIRSGDKHQRLLLAAVPQKDQARNVRRLVVSGTDITPLKEAERKLRFQAEILESVADAVVAATATLQVTYMNRAAERLFRSEQKTMLGHPLELLTGVDLVRELTRHISDSMTVQSGTFVSPQGHELVLEYSVSSQRDEDGEVAQYVAVFRDVKQRRSLEAQLLRAQKTDALGRMAGGIAHDFNNMLVVISGNAELLGETLPKDHVGQADLLEIKEAAQRAATLVRQLLAFSRRQGGTPRSCNVNEILRDNQQILRRLLRDDIELRLDLEEPLWTVVVDVGQLEQVLVQLLVNAKDAIPEIGQVKVTTRNVLVGPEGARNNLSPGRYVEVRIEDTGIGMSTETMRRLFEPFFSTKSSNRAIGLGLSMCYGIVRQYRGAITAESLPGKGSVLILWLPEENHKAADENPQPMGSISDEFRRLRNSDGGMPVFADPKRTEETKR